MVMNGMFAVLRFRAKHDLEEEHVGITKLSTTINPYLMEIDWFGHGYESNPIIIDFHALYKASKEVIFYTYVSDLNVRVGKCRTKLYKIESLARPSVAIEMEIRFYGLGECIDRIIRLSRPAITSYDAEQAVAWTKTLCIAKELIDILSREQQLKSRYGYSLNRYYTLVYHYGRVSKIQDYEELLDIVRRYDRIVPEIMCMVCT